MGEGARKRGQGLLYKCNDIPSSGSKLPQEARDDVPGNPLVMSEVLEQDLYKSILGAAR
jgi:hypothetical protein